jgi:glutaminyl-tRNA synthetase
VRATIHWVSAAHAVEAEVRLYNPLLMADRAEVLRDVDWALHLNPDSLERLTGCLAEPGLRHAPAGARFHFERQGYFCVDPDSSSDQLIFNRTASLKDTWSKIQKFRP